MLKLRKQILDLFESRGQLKSPEAEADLILLHAFRFEDPELQSITELKIFPRVASTEVVEEAMRIAELRAQGTPLQHVIGQQYFYNHEYCVNESTLIPRPETELLIQLAIQAMEERSQNKPFRFAELGLGTGILSAEMLAHFPLARGMASELNPDAITLARQNLLQVVGFDFESRIEIMPVTRGRLGFEIFRDEEPFDMILSNPPYVSIKDEIEKEVLRYEPRSALFPEADLDRDEPNYFYENFLRHAPAILKESGIAFFEVPHERAEMILELFQNSGFAGSRLISDLTGRPRVLEARS